MSDAVASYFFRPRKGISSEVAARVKLSNQTLTCSCHAVKPVFLVSGSRVRPITVSHELEAPGTDIVLMANAGIYGPPDGIAEGGRAMRQFGGRISRRNNG